VLLASPDAPAAASAILERLKNGQSIDDVAKEYQNLNADVLEATLDNDPRQRKFAGFWQQASGAHAGDVFGPIVVQGWQRGRTTPDGRQVMEQVPDALLVFQVVQEVPETPKTLEESKDDLAPLIMYAKVMDQLRKEHGIRVFEDNLPDPSMYESPSTSTVVAR
jgi:hypothetical protein